MDAVIIFGGLIVAATIIGAFILTARRSGGGIREEFDQLKSEKEGLIQNLAQANTELDLARRRLSETTEQLQSARQAEIRAAELERDLTNSQQLERRISEELQTARNRNEKLQTDVQELNAQVRSLKTEIASSEERIKERSDLEKIFGDNFKALSSESLQNQQKQFIERAQQTLKPLADKVDKLDREWATTSGAFKQQIENLTTQTHALSTAMTRPQARGQWGEMQVERALQLSGLTKGIHYETQASDLQGGRTDFIIHMPHDRDIVIDSKVSLIALIDAQNATDDSERNAHLDRHARHVQEHANSLASKEYWSNLPNAANYVVMAMPEFALPPAVERRPNLIDAALQSNVVICAHSTLVALLKTVAMGWQERELSQQTAEIAKLGRDLHDRLETYARHHARVGNELKQAVEHYNSSVGSLESMVLPQARRFKELSVQTTKEIEPISPVETAVRNMRAIPLNSPNGAEE